MDRKGMELGPASDSGSELRRPLVAAAAIASSVAAALIMPERSERGTLDEVAPKSDLTDGERLEALVALHGHARTRGRRQVRHLARLLHRRNSFGSLRRGAPSTAS